jgi:hypothetical protein
VTNQRIAMLRMNSAKLKSYLLGQKTLKPILFCYNIICPVQVIFLWTVKSTSDHTLWTLYRSYYKCISTKIELQMYSETSY